jgi:biopolymer transport protein ExbD
MLRKFVGVLVLLILMAGVIIAEEIKGKVKSVDTDKNTITVTVDDKDQTFMVTDDTKILSAKGTAVKDGLKNEKAFKAGRQVTITTDKKDGKDVVTEIKLAGGKKKQ